MIVYRSLWLIHSYLQPFKLKLRAVYFHFKDQDFFPQRHFWSLLQWPKMFKLASLKYMCNLVHMYCYLITYYQPKVCPYPKCAPPKVCPYPKCYIVVSLKEILYYFYLFLFDSFFCHPTYSLVRGLGGQVDIQDRWLADHKPNTTVVSLHLGLLVIELLSMIFWTCIWK
jgi:hypothetical protein